MVNFCPSVVYNCVELKPFIHLVLSSTKVETRPNKGRDYEISKWEEEIRKSVATKKATAVTLSKQQQALMQTQLGKEAKTRQHVRDICANLTRGLHLVRSVVTAGVDEFHSYMSSVLSLLLNGALSGGSFLVGTIAFDTYLVSSFLNAFFRLFKKNHLQELSKITSPRLDTFQRWIGIATLRCLKIGSVPADLQEEPLHSKLGNTSAF